MRHEGIGRWRNWGYWASLISALVATRREVIGITSTERGVQTLRDKGAEAFEDARLQFVGLRTFEARREKRKCK